ncbi:uncharacterized protein MYCFIDRAFT_176515 [Pseudocercospora fijiensis CIRAD86]|uniref:Uncharacterized protein n=1 Tax=Pseudocercospora fijiensis (strain CIRAD86) TaxID=383855 RepID=M3AUR8_PSEFD|nr:uncharacterized protein MYCFIDRAFT_176515 [Pseudocercospora fijiensis CIRAD86]EME81217.1 hypothetical protein MYCFIDRAFT_176515 [Pseudocercospora fijiensis CIRAD86]
MRGTVQDYATAIAIRLNVHDRIPYAFRNDDMPVYLRGVQFMLSAVSVLLPASTWALREPRFKAIASRGIVLELGHLIFTENVRKLTALRKFENSIHDDRPHAMPNCTVKSHIQEFEEVYIRSKISHQHLISITRSTTFPIKQD